MNMLLSLYHRIQYNKRNIPSAFDGISLITFTCLDGKPETRIKETRMTAKRNNNPRYLNPYLYRFSLSVRQICDLFINQKEPLVQLQVENPGVISLPQDQPVPQRQS